MPRGDGTGPRGMGAGTGRGLGGCTARGTSAARDRGAGFPQRRMNAGSGADGSLPGRGQGIGMMLLDVFLSWFERVTRK